MTFAERLKAARIAAGKTQLRLSVDIGIASSQIAGYETGGRRPSPMTLRKLEEALNVKLGEVDE